MKAKIHPEYHQAKVTCACGNTFTTGSTLPEIHVEICSNCHPFFTGQQKFIDTAGRVDRFKERVRQAELKKVTTKAPVSQAASEAPEAEAETPAEETK